KPSYCRGSGGGVLSRRPPPRQPVRGVPGLALCFSAAGRMERPARPLPRRRVPPCARPLGRTIVALFGSVLPTCLALPLTVFLAEMCVVTLGPLRTIFVARGGRFLAPAFGFVEVVIWLFAVGQTMQNLGNPACYIAFAAGFTVGNFLGLQVEGRL